MQSPPAGLPEALPVLCSLTWKQETRGFAHHCCWPYKPRLCSLSQGVEEWKMRVNLEKRIQEVGSRIKKGLGFHGGSDGKESVLRPGFNLWVEKIPERRENPLQYSCWRIPWTEEPGRLQFMGCKESDMTEQLTLSLLGKMNRRLARSEGELFPSHVSAL